MWFRQSVFAGSSREEDISLIAGLDGAVTSVAMINENTTVLEAPSHFCSVDKMVKILLQTIDNGVIVKTILSIGGISKQVSIIRLKVNPESFLVLCPPLEAKEFECEKEFFCFMPELVPRHFTWKMDKSGWLFNVSKDLAQIIWHVSSSILGSNFHELANQFNDERYQVLSGFIEAAMPWSKQAVQSPVDGC
ncbi:hypothetical protein MCQ_00155 [Candidatus Bartonella washoeensis Sb944nv]|uniref:Uncharacterized protein n=1 Tax=Candidatus Bartonella washoeensis Sb944nv TaxID=1094563 RepID=J1JAS4_9HYPH|nr:hypothetical protein [Bartonella washoeensis]EJF81457.1 hypothetical protein MCQ_00155 [Bartonella washoeensis Sb944nv]